MVGTNRRKQRQQLKVQFCSLTLDAIELVGICVDKLKHSMLSKAVTSIEEFELRVEGVQVG